MSQRVVRAVACLVIVGGGLTLGTSQPTVAADAEHCCYSECMEKCTEFNTFEYCHPQCTPCHRC